MVARQPVVALTLALAFALALCCVLEASVAKV